MSQPTDLNPYASPQSLSDEDEDERLAVEGPIVPATQGLRFANYLIDSIALFGVNMVAGVLIAILGGEEGLAFIEKIPDFIIGLPFFLAYYVLLEATTSRTLGKLLTGTMVVNEDGGKPALGQVIGRTFARFIPFEAFSFLGKTTRGWHDSLAKTYVVKSR